MALFAHAAFAATGAIQGSVKVKSAKYAKDIVVYVKSIDGKFAPPKDPVEYDQEKLLFLPHVLPILDGTTVMFLNSDKVKHNVFSPDFEQFDLGTWAPGGKQKYVFSLLKGKKADKDKKVVEPDPIRAYVQLCNVHPEMEGYVVVLPNPYFAVTDEKGKFTLKGIPEGRHTLFAWSEKYKPREVEATVSSKNTTTVTIDFTQ